MRPGVDGADWYFDQDRNLQVRICPMCDWRHEALLAIHEACEAILCFHNGVSVSAVDTFDVQFDRTHSDDIEAGDDPQSPYRREHTFATAIERIMAGAMNVDWKTYDDSLRATYPGPSHRPT